MVWRWLKKPVSKLQWQGRDKPIYGCLKSADICPNTRQLVKDTFLSCISRLSRGMAAEGGLTAGSLLEYLQPLIIAPNDDGHFLNAKGIGCFCWITLGVPRRAATCRAYSILPRRSMTRVSGKLKFSALPKVMTSTPKSRSFSPTAPAMHLCRIH